MSFFSSSTNSRTLRPEWLEDQTEQTRDAYFNMADPTAFGQDWGVGMNDMLSGAYGNLFNSTNQQGLADSMANMSQWGFGAGQDAFGNYGRQLDLLNRRGPNQFQYDQGTFDQAFGNLTGGLQNQFDLGANQIQQNFDWNALPGLNMSAALGGNQGATKGLQQTALGQAQADQNKMQFGSNLWTNAANQANANAMTGGMANLNTANAFDQQNLGGYMDMAKLGLNTGMGAGTNAYNMNQGIAQNMLTAGTGMQDFLQQDRDYDRTQHYFDQQMLQDWNRQRFQDATNAAAQFARNTQSTNPSGFSNLTNTIGAVGQVAMGIPQIQNAWTT